VSETIGLRAMKTTSKPAFTLVELVVAISVSAILVGITASTYSLFRRQMALDQNRTLIAQNARIALDRLSRELRQTPAIVTQIPVSPSDTSVLQPGQIEFEDGHANDLTYRRYYIQDGILRVDIKQYYFTYDSGVRVRWNEIGAGGVTPVSNVITTHDVADQVQSIVFYRDFSVTILLTTQDGDGQSFQLRTTIHGRNI
jgi:prepilin-type N-terminal cleavage/methylation domain-containing protein